MFRESVHAVGGGPFARSRHGSLRDASVVGVSDAWLDQVPFAAVERVEDSDLPTEDELVALIRARSRCTTGPSGCSWSTRCRGTLR